MEATTAAGTDAGRRPLGAVWAAPLAILSGLLYWLAFPGRDLWPLSLVAFVPLLVALRGQRPRRALWLGLLAGLTMNVTGFFWLIGLLDTFAGFPLALNILFMTLLCTYQGGRVGLMGWLYARASQRGWPPALVALGAFAASELAYPLLFPWYFGATVHNAVALEQIADLGGPVLVGLVLLGANLALTEIVLARLVDRRPMDRRVVLGGFGALALSAGYGYVRIRQVDARALASEPLHVGMVQANLGLMQNMTDAGVALRRQVSLTHQLRARGAQLVVWSESSVTIGVTENLYRSFYGHTVAAQLGVPAIFGAVVLHDDPDPAKFRAFNTALSSDAKGAITGRYDKHYLLAFGEYIPFGDEFPSLYRWSPNSGQLSPGTSLDPLPVPTATGIHPVSVLICYEDILPAYTNAMVRHADPELLVNMTNDAWFGDSSEPREHLALATMRSVEHRRYMVRATNTGVSAVVDPVGRVLVQTPTFRIEARDAVVHLMRGKTVYEVVGDWPLWALAALTAVGAFVRRRRVKAP